MDYIIVGIHRILDKILEIYIYIIVTRAIISWVSIDPHKPIVSILIRITEPVLRPIRKLISPSLLGVDFSAMIVILIILFLRYDILPLLFNW